MELFVVVAILSLFGLAAQHWGADSRTDSVDPTLATTVLN
jgi:hypothetical protein